MNEIENIVFNIEEKILTLKTTDNPSYEFQEGEIYGLNQAIIIIKNHSKNRVLYISKQESKEVTRFKMAVAKKYNRKLKYTNNGVKQK